MPTSSPALRTLAAGRTAALALVLLAGLAPAGASDTAAARSPAEMREVDERSLDDPVAARRHAEQRLAELGNGGLTAGERASAFWLHLALADLQAQTDLPGLAERHAQAARELLPDAASPAARRARLWLEHLERYLQPAPRDLSGYRQAQALARDEARALGDEALLCRLDLGDAVVKVELDLLDEAWAALEAVERCAARLGDAAARAYALGTMGTLAGRIGAAQSPETFYQRALQALGDRPARYRRAWLLDDLGWALVHAGRAEEARAPFEQVLALALDIGDLSFTMRGHEGLAEVALRRNDAETTLRHARESLRLGASAPGLRFRLVTAQTQVVEALAQLRRPPLAAEIERLRAMAQLDPSSRTGALIARSAARGYRALGQHAAAYAELERYLLLARSDETSRRERDAQRLQARHEAALREAENRELRHAAEVAQLQLAAREERQRALWLLVAALATALTAGGWQLQRVWRHRRRLSDLALRDELTGAPNRRAVRAYAQEQLALARRVQAPLLLALVDLDRFKRINDECGHEAGDAVLRAFAEAAGAVLRGPERAGRWGGEEWLLVLPGSGAPELRELFTRLRDALRARCPSLAGSPDALSFSMGAVDWREVAGGLDDLLAEADRRLYQAKRAGRDQLCLAAPPARLAEADAPR